MMKRERIVHLLTTALLVAVPLLSQGQQFQRLYDIDSLYNYGWTVFQQTDSNYFINGWGIDMIYGGGGGAINVKINIHDNYLYMQKKIHFFKNLFGTGDPGQAVLTNNGDYVMPLTVQRPRGTYVSSRGGLVKFNADGDTVFAKTYTDTSVYFDYMAGCCLFEDGGYGICGTHATNIPSYPPGYIMRTDSMGDTLWTHTYRRSDREICQVSRISALSGGRMVAGAYSRYTYFLMGNAIYHYIPWFMVLDSHGDIIRDTVYGSRYGDGAAFIPDKGGGYLHYGRIDTLFDPRFPDDMRNFPYYVSHIDTNFRMSWIHIFRFSEDTTGKRIIMSAKQLRDGSYIVLGDGIGFNRIGVTGWAAKLSRSGELLWDHWYQSDSNNVSRLRDMVELSDGSLVFTGWSFNDTLPRWRGGADLWLLRVDSNGCEVSGCNPFPWRTSVPEVAPPAAAAALSFSLYPNPNSGTFSVQVATGGQLQLSGIDGRELGSWAVGAGATQLQLPVGLAAGMYVATYRSSVGGQPQVVRLVYQP